MRGKLYLVTQKDLTGAKSMDDIRNMYHLSNDWWIYTNEGKACEVASHKVARRGQWTRMMVYQIDIIWNETDAASILSFMCDMNVHQWKRWVFERIKSIPVKHLKTFRAVAVRYEVVSTPGEDRDVHELKEAQNG